MITVILLILAAAGGLVAFFVLRKKKAPAAPPEPFEQMLLRTEGVTIDDITFHEDGDPPDPKKLYDAWVRGRNRVTAIYPEAAKVQMSDVFFRRPKLLWVPDKPYPLIDRNEGSGLPVLYDRAVTSITVPSLIRYAYEECVEHEACHALVLRLDGGRKRTPEAIAADPGESSYDGPPMEYFFQIVCHNTPDDPFSEGPPGNRAGCCLPYSGPPNPLTA